MKLVVVKFADPIVISHWTTLEDAEKIKPRTCYAHGRLLTENKEVVRVSLLSSEDNQDASSWITIPAGCVISVDIIKEIDWNEG